jgi:hypothetical protein
MYVSTEAQKIGGLHPPQRNHCGFDTGKAGQMH